MKTLSNTNLHNQIREKAFLEINTTGHPQPYSLFFVQFDDDHSVGSDGCIYQLLPVGYLNDDFCPLLIYKSEYGNLYNYAEDTDDFEIASKDREIFDHCKAQAELLSE